MRIRPARLDDAAVLARIYVAAWRDTYAGILPDALLVSMSDVRHAAAWQQELSTRDSHSDTLVAEDDDGVLGLLTLGPARRVSRAQLEGGEIYRLYVAPDRQGEGAGKALLMAGFDWLISRDVDAVIIWVLADNPSRFFYEAMGGTRLGEKTDSVGGTKVREVAYGWTDLVAALDRLAAR
ncbi:GNAT family N-acetyltransferase [Reyranella sp. CPCC 100927]|uniref:GNAT family N-acetyltransferase n=1 Tax=Reyranella sp. CPCC 100927 TaxID=2599616 RepID=UPI0011B4D6F9|nr:GNAT family N-acetyltransferase [Reyranella sp. CPCC 100927]TWT10284.1 GNAT family N-acetyltransferase [Reyranella sp. CPCC 100927]